MSVSPRQLLGLAFASADLFIEILDGKISLTLGAARKLLGYDERHLHGWPICALFHLDDQPLVEAMLACAQDGARRGPVVLRLAGPSPRHVQITLRALPENGGRISCAMTTAHAVKQNPPPGRLQPRAAFDDMARGLCEAARVAGHELELAMIEFAGLGAMRAGLSAAEAAVLDAQVSNAVRAEAHGGAAATKLSENRFALLRQREDGQEGMIKRLTTLVSAKASAQVMPLEFGDGSASAMRALRYALDDFMTKGVRNEAALPLSEAINRSVQRTLERAGALGAVIQERRFRLAYQPVVDLATGLAHHYEVLIRFADGESPFAQIRMAEAFDLIEQLDLAIAEQAIEVLANDRTGQLKLAVNVSGRTIGAERFNDRVAEFLTQHPAARERIIFEVTETAAIDDLTIANRNIQTLRALGSQVCLDDFGAGAASFDYLRRLKVDIVKIDGRYVRELADNSRDGILVRQIVGLCRDLNMRTVAEMVETPEIEEVVRQAGFDFVQGWLYGRAADRPSPPAMPRAPEPVRVARRSGFAESWG